MNLSKNKIPMKYQLETLCIIKITIFFLFILQSIQNVNKIFNLVHLISDFMSTLGDWKYFRIYMNEYFLKLLNHVIDLRMKVHICYL